jgi:CheY-like chemotaxis protein
MASILLVDDDELLRGVLAKALALGGHAVIQASDGKAAMRLAATQAIDLVITDIVMPVQEGLETIMALRRDRPALPIIAMSGGATNSRLYLQIAAKVGARRMLSKPFSPGQLLDLVDEVLKSPPSGTKN